MAYTDVFSGSNVYPADTTLLAVALSSNIALEWPFEGADPTYPAARIIDVTCTAASSITLPDATEASPGYTILFNSLSASTHDITVKDAGGNTLATISSGEQWQLYLASNATAAGTWRVFQFGASTATVQASDLAGAGLVVQSNQLAQAMPVTTFTGTPRTILTSDLGGLFVWTGTGAATVNLPAVASAGAGYFIALRNDSTAGDVTVDANGSETIDGATTLTLQPGESAFLGTDGTAWYTLGLGKDSIFAFDYTTIDLSASGATYTLSGSELNRVAYKFTGLITTNIEVVVPKTFQQYWVDNSTTGAFTVKLKTSGGTPVTVNQSTRGLYYCDGSNVLDADTGGISTPISAADGGTGQTTYTVGDILYASATNALSRLADVATGNALISGGLNTAPAWGKIGLTTHVSGTLPAANGGTGQTTATSGRVLIGDGTNFVLCAFTNTTGITWTVSPGTNVISATLASMTSATFAGFISDETGTGKLVFGTQPNLIAPSGVSNAVGASTVDCSTGDHFTKTATGNITWTFSNPPTTGLSYAFTLELTNGGAYTMTWPASVDWPSGTAPTLTSSGKDIIGFFTRDAGTTWHGLLLNRDTR